MITIKWHTLDECLEQAGGFPFVATNQFFEYLFVRRSPEIHSIFQSSMWQGRGFWVNQLTVFRANSSNWRLTDYFEPESVVGPKALMKSIIIPDCFCPDQTRCRPDCKYGKFKRLTGASNDV